jgi:glucosylceramidase
VVQAVLSTTDLSEALTPMPSQRFTTPRHTSAPVIDINDRRHYQRVTGFGAAMTDTSAWLIHDELAPAARRALLRSLFGPSGIGLSYLRVPMGGSDFTVLGAPYSYDDLPAGVIDPQLDNFSVVHDYAYILPTLEAVLNANRHTQILAAPWSPPAWMKTNDSLANPYDEGSLRGWAYPVLARYFVKFIRAYRDWGVPIAAVTPQNEPQAGALYAGLNLSEPQEAMFVSQFLAPALRAAHLRTAIYGLDRGADFAYAEALVQGTANRNLAGIAWHCYGGMQVMSALHAVDPRVHQVVSECAPGIVPFPPAEVLISGLRNWASAVALWNVALDPAGGPVEMPNSACTGCTPLVTISEQTHRATRDLDFYQLGQFSKFIQPGAVQIAATRLASDFRTARGWYGVTPGLDDVAFLDPDGTRVLVVYDNAASRRKFAVRWRGKMFSYALAPGTTATFTWR